ncbi:MAG: RNase P subunit p30 family protein [Candidatus Hydrothermarchaeota archaeon]|nr:RNase P subunit p30 family protein [Candidatus Hydrothermarchaeota archaeon]
MKFIDLHVHSNLSSGRDSPAEMLEHAKKLGIEIGLCDGKRGGYISGVEIRAGLEDFKNSLSKALLDYTIVHGGDYDINRLAASSSRVDILAHPDLGRKDSGLDAVLARKAAENSVAIEVNLGSIIKSGGSSRAHALKNIRRNLMLSRKYKFDLVAASGAKSRLELRSADGVSELLKLIGFTEEEALSAMGKIPEKILNRRRG